MKICIFSKTFVDNSHELSILDELSKFPEVKLTLVTPTTWGKKRITEKFFNRGFKVILQRIYFSGRYHYYFYSWNIRRILKEEKPDLILIDEEPFNPATFQILFEARRLPILKGFTTFQNIYKLYPFPYNLFENYAFSEADFALPQTEECAEILRKKGYAKERKVILLHGVNTQIFQRGEPLLKVKGLSGLIVGYIGRLVWEKGVDLLIRACKELEREDFTLLIVGDGKGRRLLKDMVERLSFSSKVVFHSSISSWEVPKYLNLIDILVLPSRTTSHWKEQLGRILIEAMSCEVAVIGSSSGEIPRVIGNAGMVFEELSMSL